MVPELRPYQVATEEKIVAAAQRGARVIVVQGPTGSGKTSQACSLAKRAAVKGKRVLLIAHRRRLVEQMSERLTEFETLHGVLMRGHKMERQATVQVASKDTLASRCLNNQFFDLPPADLVIVDEFRHSVALEYRDILNHYTSRGAWVVGLDATPVLADGTGLGPWAQAMVVSAKPEDLIRDGYLCPVKCFAPDRKNDRRGKVKRGIAGDLVNAWKEYANGLPTVLFVSRIQHSRDAVDAFLESGVQAVHIDAKTSDFDRDEAFENLARGTVQVISNVGIVKEGVDVPCLGCCQFYMDPSSRTAFLQACGRIMRPYPGKQTGTVIDHAGAVFRYGFPDEGMDWPLNGNVNQEWEQRHRDGLTEKVLYCRQCELMYKGGPCCPQCGRQPTVPPRSVFQADPIEHTSELLYEAERGSNSPIGREERVKHWLRCIGVANARKGSFSMAAAIYRQKYSEWPRDDFPCCPPSGQWKRRITDLYPDFGKKKVAQ